MPEKLKQDEFNYWLKRNESSKATALGGLNRMRAYSQGRFYAANSSNYVLEYRLNYSEKRTPMNWIVLGGIRTVLQTSFFYETGSVSDDISRLHKKMKSSFGVGFRAIIFRADFTVLTLQKEMTALHQHYLLIILCH